MSSGQGPLVSRCRARPWKESHKRGVCLRGRPAQLQMSLFIQGQPGQLPGWVKCALAFAPPRQTSPARRPPPPSPAPGLSSCSTRSPTFVIYRPACLLCVWGVFSSPDNGGDNCGGTVFSKWNYKPLKICPSALKKDVKVPFIHPQACLKSHVPLSSG